MKGLRYNSRCFSYINQKSKAVFPKESGLAFFFIACFSFGQAVGKEARMNKDQLAEYLKAHHLGKENAILSRELEKLFCVNGKELRDFINVLRREAIPIASDQSGYYFAKTESELRATIRHMRRRIAGISAAIRGLNRSLSNFDTAQTRLPLMEGGEDSE